jgi:uncharacterized membrane protein YhhN
MANVSTVTGGPVVLPRRRPLFLAGALLFLLGPVIYIVEFSLKHLGMPWYIPIMATVGVLFMAMSVMQRWGIFRTLGLIVFALLCAGEWFALVAGTKTPAYTGPAQAGNKLPSFATKLADGSAFTEKNLEGGQRTALVFFRGRW